MKTEATEPPHDPVTGEVKTGQGPKEEGPRSFLTLLGKVADGELESSGSYELHELAKRLQELSALTHGKAKGKLKLILNMVADPSGTVGLTYSIDVTAPKMPTTPALFWLTKGGNLSPTNPKQMGLPLRDVSPPKREIREPASAAQPREV